VLLLDLMMPLMDGMTLLVELERRKELVDIQVVVMTATSASVETSTLPYPLLRKPFALEALLEIVAMYLPADGRAKTRASTQG
jgi:CheY-like chemotaxis protein